MRLPYFEHLPTIERPLYGNSDFQKLRIWFEALDDTAVTQNPKILVAKGAFLSVFGNFVESEACLEAAIPLINTDDKELYFGVMIHKARILRNFVSFEESNALLDKIFEMLDNPTGEMAYSIAIEKLYNLCWNSMHWAKMQRLTYSLIFTGEPKDDIVREIFKNLGRAGAYLKSLVLARLMGYFAAISDLRNAVNCTKLCIETGDKAGMFLHTTMAYGILTRAAIEAKDYEKSVFLTRRYLNLCYENGLYEYFRLQKAYGPVLEFAYNNGIQPEFAQQMMEFAGYRQKKCT